MNSEIKLDPIFESVNLGSINGGSRIAMAPLTRARALSCGCPSEMMAKYYASRMSAGFIFTESVSISNSGKTYRNMPCLYNNKHKAAWRAFLSELGTKRPPVVIQLQHGGRVSHSSILGGQKPQAPSPVRLPGLFRSDDVHLPYETPKEMTQSEIDDLLESYYSSSLMAKELGFDGVEINCAWGNLLDCFFQSISNFRLDGYGGSIEKRARIICEVLRVVTDVYGPDRVGLRLSPNSPVNGMGSPDGIESIRYLFSLKMVQDLAYVHVTLSDTCGHHNRHRMFDYSDIRSLFKGKIVASGALDYSSSSRLIKSRDIDVAAFGRSFISYFDLNNRIKNKMSIENIVSHSMWYTGGSSGYVIKSQ